MFWDPTRIQGEDYTIVLEGCLRILSSTRDIHENFHCCIENKLTFSV